MSAAYWIVFWWLVFAGSHMVLSSLPLRGQLIARLGEKGFVGLYSLIAFATFIPLVWVYFGNRHAGGVIWNLAAAPGVRPLAAALAVLAIALIVGGVLHPSPALVGMKQSWGARGLTRITRHPLFMGFALWALSHLLLNGFLTDVLFFGGMLAFSLAGAAHQDARKRATEEERLGQFFAESSYWPFGAIIAGRNRIIWRELPWIALAVGAAAAIGIYALHPWAFA
ncbi:MAG TPA: NnrU family protein [Burkholderiales bacterium]|nr:NnrU family protein [Burkholderiales bacterium]